MSENIGQLRLTRAQLAVALGNNHDTIVQFEQLLRMASVLTPDQIDILIQILNRLPPGSDSSSMAQDGEPGIPGTNGTNGRDGDSVPGFPGMDGQDGVSIGVPTSTLSFGPTAIATLTVCNGMVVDYT